MKNFLKLRTSLLVLTIGLANFVFHSLFSCESKECKVIDPANSKPAIVVYRGIGETGKSWNSTILVVYSYTEGPDKLYTLPNLNKAFIELRENDTISLQIEDGQVTGCTWKEFKNHKR